MKKYVAFMLILAMCIMMIPHSFASDSVDSNLTAVQVKGKYHPADIMAALENTNEKDPAKAAANQALLNDVLLPASMGITTPRIDPSKVLQTRDVYTLDPAFAEELTAHGIRRSSMTLSEYYALERTWKMPEDFIASAKYVYPELVEVDVSEWTYGMYQDYAAEQDRARFLARITPDQMEQITSRGIQISDLSILMKEYHSIEAILKQSNKSLKSSLEKAYAFTYDKVAASAAERAGYDPGDPYEFVLFPRYNGGNGDYFHEYVLTTSYWMGIQADRALRTQQCIYDSTSRTLYCTNMYGTYSYTQGGAHEGIDFTDPRGHSTPLIYAVFAGEVIKNYDGQLSVFDENSPDWPKTYTYLHMSAISPSASSNVDVYDSVGRQGNVGTSGCHVHFEVHNTEITVMSFGNDHEIESASPYRIQDYIGELPCVDPHTQWSSNTACHWKECNLCGHVSPSEYHSFSNGICTVCGRAMEDLNK